jgi:hypothetical protein
MVEVIIRRSSFLACLHQNTEIKITIICFYALFGSLLLWRRESIIICSKDSLTNLRTFVDSATVDFSAARFDCIVCVNMTKCVVFDDIGASYSLKSNQNPFYVSLCSLLWWPMRPSFLFISWSEVFGSMRSWRLPRTSTQNQAFESAWDKNRLSDSRRFHCDVEPYLGNCAFAEPVVSQPCGINSYFAWPSPWQAFLRLTVFPTPEVDGRHGVSEQRGEVTISQLGDLEYWFKLHLSRLDA